MKRLMILSGLLLAACTDPRALCLNEASKDLRIVQALIADTETTIERGYAIRTETSTIVYTTFCLGQNGKHGGFTFCNQPYPVTTKTPVAVDLNAEKAKLKSLRQKERELQQKSKIAAQRCELEHPLES